MDTPTPSPPGLTMPNRTARSNLNSWKRRWRMWNNTPEKKKYHWPVWLVSQPSLQLSPLPFAVSSGLSLTEPVPPPLLLWSRKEHKHLSQLPPSISPASHAEVVDLLGKFTLSHHHLQLLSLRYLLIPLLVQTKQQWPVWADRRVLERR